MNKWLLLLIVIGFGGAAWLNRETISGWFGHKPAEEPPPPLVQATPHPAKESRELATRTYPALARPGTAFNARFIALYNGLKESNPAFLTQADWPMLLAARTAKDLAGTPTPVAVTHVGANPLESRPGLPTATITPIVSLPGLSGSALDQRPAPKLVH